MIVRLRVKHSDSLLISYDVDKIFTELSEGMVIRKNSGNYNFFVGFEGERRILTVKTKYRGLVELSKTLVWVEPQTLDESNLIEFEKERWFGDLAKLGSESRCCLPTKVGKKSILLTNESDFSLLDLEEKTIKNSFSHAPDMKYEKGVKVRVVSEGLHSFWTCADNLVILKRQKLENGENLFESLTKIYLHNHFPREDSLKFERDFSILKLQSGNWLFVGLKSAVDPTKRTKKPGFLSKPSERKVRGISMEICSKTLKVVDSWMMGGDQDEFTNKSINIKKFYLSVNDLLVAPIRLKEKNQGIDNHVYGLGLWDKRLNLLDKGSKRNHASKGFNCIVLFCKDKIVTRRSKAHYTLFKIDPEEKKIIPFKSISILSSSVDHVDQCSETNTFRCMAKGEEAQDIEIPNFILKFNLQLELLAWTPSIKQESRDYTNPFTYK